MPLPRAPDNAIAIHPDHIALISEWDTVYGRNLVETVSAAFAKTGDQKRVAARPEWIEAYSYLRGLDGRVPDRRTPKQQPQASNSEGAEQKPDNHPNATPDTASKFESAEGQSQYDYLRRLAEVIHLRDDELRRNGERIAAIGVLGSDVYDKLLILQALRPELPNALYFTTDLDALLLPQEKTRYTRNLLVASGFGLTLDSDLQADIPPFRNTYQSSIFLATRLAVQNEWSDSRPDAASKADTALKCWSMRPVLFQIGRSAPRALPSVFKDSAPGGNGDNCPKQSGSLVDITDRRSVQPSVAELSPELGWWGRLGIGLLLAALAITALLGSHTVRRACFPHSGATPSSAGFVQPRFSRLILMFAGVLAVSVGLSLAWPLTGPFLTENGFGEPVALFEGISGWPTIVLRTLGTGLSLWLICCTLQSLEKNKRTAKEFGLRDTS